MPVMQGKYALTGMLQAEGVEYVFGNPGTSEGPFLEALAECPDIKYVLCVQEGVAVGMADGYARASGKVGFVSLHIDSGLANGLSLLNDSNFSGTPLVVTAANKDVRKLAEGRSDLARMCEPFTKWSVEITHAEQFPSVLRRAFTAARTPPTGPVFVGFSGNALEDEAEVSLVPSRAPWSAARPDREAIGEAAAHLAGADRPVLIVGDRVGEDDAVAEAVRVAELTGARVYSHLGSQVNFPTGHPQFMGNFVPRNQASRQAVQAADVVLAVGTHVFSDLFYQPGALLPAIGHAHPLWIAMPTPSVAPSRRTWPSWPRPRWAWPSLARPWAPAWTGPSAKLPRPDAMLSRRRPPRNRAVPAASGR